MAKKSVLLSIVVIILTVCLLDGSTYAYFTDTRVSGVKLTTGTVKIKVVGKSPRCIDSTESAPQIQPDCDEDNKNDQYFLAEWTIKNVGSAPVYLESTVAASFNRGKPAKAASSAAESENSENELTKEPQSGEPEVHAANDVTGWELDDGRYSYIGNHNGTRRKTLEPNQSASFSLPFFVEGPKGRYSLSMCLKVTALQTAGFDESSEAEEDDAEESVKSSDSSG